MNQEDKMEILKSADEVEEARCAACRPGRSDKDILELTKLIIYNRHLKKFSGIAGVAEKLIAEEMAKQPNE